MKPWLNQELQLFQVICSSEMKRRRLKKEVKAVGALQQVSLL
jgi:hypothetical protein